MKNRMKNRRYKNKKKSRGPIILLILFLILLFLNIEQIGRKVYPFPYREQVSYYAGIYQVNPYLIAAIIKTESNFKKNAVSQSGARGLMQIMPETGQWIAKQTGEHNFDPDRLFDPETSIRLGTWYVADLQKEFHRDPILVLAAYNGGRGNVREWLDQKEWHERQTDIEMIPFPETRYFIKKVLLNHVVYTFLYSRQDMGRR